MSDLKINNITNRGGDGGPVIAGVSTVSSSAFIIMPNGNTEIRGAASGTVLAMGGYADPSARNVIHKITIATTGDATDFGDTTSARYSNPATASATRGFLLGGSPDTFTIDYVSFSSGGGSNDFGNLQLGVSAWGARANDSVRGFVLGGTHSPVTGPGPRISTIQAITMASTGDAVIFGDLTQVSRRGSGTSSPTRAIHYTGRDDPARTKDIQIFTMASGGNAVKFGEATSDRDSFIGGFSSGTRGVFGGGQGPSSPTTTNRIDFITIATEGNAQDFGDLTVKRMSGAGASSKVRGLFTGGYDYPGSVLNKDIIEYVTIATTGDAIDFGDLIQATRNHGACSDVNGGLG